MRKKNFHRRCLARINLVCDDLILGENKTLAGNFKLPPFWRGCFYGNIMAPIPSRAEITQATLIMRSHFAAVSSEGHFVCACSAESILMWVTAGMRLLCVHANRKMPVVSTNFSAVFPFVTCVKESENQPNGFGESRRKSQPSPFRRSSLNKRSRLDNLFLKRL